MKHLLRLACSCALALAYMLLAAAARADAARLGSYDFAYFMSGDVRARPVQVFDDGSHTYFQFRAGEAVPAIFAGHAGMPQLVVPTQEGPYLRVPQLHGRFVLQVGRAQAQVVHARGERPDAPPISAVHADGMRQPLASPEAIPMQARLVASVAAPRPPDAVPAALDRNSYATPVHGDGVYWPDRGEQIEHGVAFARGAYVLAPQARRALARIAEQSGRLARFTVIGRDDDTYKEGLDSARAGALREALLKAGVAGERITVRTGVMKPGDGKAWLSTVLVDTPAGAPVMRPAPPGARTAAAQQLAPANATGAPAPGGPAGLAPAMPEGGFTLLAADRTVAGAARRWAQALRYELVWDAPSTLDAAIAGDARLPARDLSEALEQLVRGLKDKGYGLEVTIYTNRVIRFSPADTSAPGRPAPSPAAGITAAGGLTPATRSASTH